MLDIVYFEEISSTNDVAAHILQKGRDIGDTLVLANKQTSGRGRLNGRTWVSSPGNFHGTYIVNIKDLCVSENSIALLNSLTLLAIRDELSKIIDSHADITIKFPNDILVSRKKIGGALIEVSYPHALIGIGINLIASPIDSSTDLKREFNVLVDSKELGQNLYMSLVKRIQDEKL